MSDSTEQPVLGLQELADAARQVAEPADFAGRAQRLVTIVRAWANPAAIVGLVRDTAAESGLRVLPELSVGYSAGTAGQERALARLIEEAGPERAARPWLLPPPAEVAGLNLKARDSWIVPWSVAGASGYLLLRGVPTPYPANLAEAVALVAPTVWTLLPAMRTPGSLARLEAVLSEARSLFEQVQRQFEGERSQLASAAPAEAAHEVGPDLAPPELREAREALVASVAERDTTKAAHEAALANAAATQAALAAERDELRAKLVSAEHAAESQAADLEAVHAELANLRTHLAERDSQTATANAEAALRADELATARQRVQELEAAAEAARGQAERAREESASQIEQLRGESAAAQVQMAAARDQAASAQSESAAELERLRTELAEQAELARTRQQTADERQAQLERLQAENISVAEESTRLRTEWERTQEQLRAAQAEVEGARTRVAAASAEASGDGGLAGQAPGHEELRVEFERVRTELSEQLARSQDQAAHARAEADEARAELERLRAAAPTPGDPQSQAELERARDEAVALLEQARAQGKAAQTEAEQARAAAAAAREEIERLRERLQVFEGPMGGALGEGTAPIAPGTRLLALEAAATEAVGLRERLDAVEQAREALASQLSESQARLPALEQEAAARAEELASLRNELVAERLRAETERQALEGARQALRSSESLLASQAGEAEAARRQRGALQEQIELAERARASAEAERDRARAEVNPLWSTIESLQRQIKDEEQRRAVLATELSAAQGVQSAASSLQARLQSEAAALHERVMALEQAHAEAERRAQEAEQLQRAEAERSASGVQALRSAWEALRRTPFVPPTLRVSFTGVQELLAGEGPHTASKGLRVLLLDRDTPGLESLATALEAEGVDVLIAHYADEAAFFLKTPEARQLGAVIGDVMAFRNELDLLERYRLWRLDHPALALLVSCRSEDPVESERARRLPPALGAVQLGRPLTREAVLEGVQRAVRRPTARPPEPPPSKPPTRR